MPKIKRGKETSRYSAEKTWNILKNMQNTGWSEIIPPSKNRGGSEL